MKKLKPLEMLNIFKMLRELKYNRYIDKIGVPTYIHHKDKETECTCFWDNRQVRVDCDMVVPILNKYFITTDESKNGITTIYTLSKTVQ